MPLKQDLLNREMSHLHSTPIADATTDDGVVHQLFE